MEPRAPRGSIGHLQRDHLANAQPSASAERGARLFSLHASLCASSCQVWRLRRYGLLLEAPQWARRRTIDNAAAVSQSDRQPPRCGDAQPISAREGDRAPWASRQAIATARATGKADERLLTF